MKLMPVIASYSAETASSMGEYLAGDGALDTVAFIARAPRRKERVPPGILEELEEMRALHEEGDVVSLATAFLVAADLERIAEVLILTAREFAALVVGHGSSLRGAPPRW